ncbi:MAG: RDD family protein [Acidobacteriia bacterium]|nr:RDD family protein [Terriglobia bacterium]
MSGEPLEPEAAGRPLAESAAPDAAGSESRELPEWRQELSRRLQEIKLKREAGNGGTAASEAAAGAETAETRESVAEEPEPPSLRQAGPRKPRRAARIAVRDLPPVADAAVPPDQLSTSPTEPAKPEPQASEPKPLEPPVGDVVVRPSVEKAELSRKQDIQNLIDAAVAKQAAREQPVAPEPKPESKPMPAPKLEPARGPEPRMAPEPRRDRKIEPEHDREIRISQTLPGEPREGKLILLSRTLAGLVDLIIIAICAGMIILSVDVLEGIEMLDSVSMIYYALLFLLTYFVYSFFFLGMASQTVGMMLTDLRVVGASIRSLSAGQILVRCCTFLLGLAALGVGLLWGCLDRQSRCLHDRFSQTRVVRVMWY